MLNKDESGMENSYETAKLVEKMTIEEKAAILSGKTVWQTREIDRLSISCCAAETKENGRLIMGAEDVWNVSLTAPEAKLYRHIWIMLLMHQLHALRCVAN